MTHWVLKYSPRLAALAGVLWIGHALLHGHVEQTCLTAASDLGRLELSEEWDVAQGGGFTGKGGFLADGRNAMENPITRCTWEWRADPYHWWNRL